MARKNAKETSAAAAPAQKARTVKSTGAAATHKAPAIRAVKAEPIFKIEEHRDEIARQAYYFFLERGGSHGSAAEDWIRAEAETRRRWQMSVTA